MSAYRECLQAIAELSLISHAPTQTIHGAPPEGQQATPSRWRTDDRRAPVAHLGSHATRGADSRVPTGKDGEYRPHAPKASLTDESDEDAIKAWDEYLRELADWRASYQRKTPALFRRRLRECATDGQLEALRDEVRGVVSAWKRAPMPVGQPPEFGSPQWKRWVAESPKDGGELARLFNTTRQYIGQVRKAYREAA